MSNNTFKPQRRRHLIQLAALSTLAVSPIVRAQRAQPLRILVGFSAGGATDTLIRIITTELGNILIGQWS